MVMIFKQQQYLKRFLSTIFVITGINFILFDIFINNKTSPVKQSQFSIFLKPNNNYYFIDHLAEFIHSRAPFLEVLPYATQDTDTRLATWYLPPHQVVIEWLIFVLLFVGTVVQGIPKVVGYNEIRINKKLNFVLFQISLWTILVVVYYKVRAWVELGEWFSVLYLLQPCHVLVTGYVVLSALLIRDGERPSKLSAAVMHVLFDLQWFTSVAIVLPDMTALIERNFFGEFFMFYWEHVLLLVLPIVFQVMFFRSCKHPDWKATLYRAWYSLCWFGLHHIQVMTPVSIASGVQINYQTHLPEYAMEWFFGRAYKSVITGAALFAVTVFALCIDPACKWAAKKLAKGEKKDIKINKSS